ncbi:MAG: NYN domain-containing protein [Rhodobacteraceae bacterium]|nr:NYN domain-containing protein [Paracoccaceae bacterium]
MPQEAAGRKLAGEIRSPETAITAPRPRLAVLIDGDSIPVRFAALAFPRVVRLGRVMSCCVYGNLPRVGRPCWRTAASEVSSLPELRFSHKTGSNAADFDLTFDAAQLKPGDVDAVCVMSCDGHMAHAVQRLRERGLTVHVFGRSQTARTLKRAASQFHLIEFPTRIIRPAAETGARA